MSRTIAAAGALSVLAVSALTAGQIEVADTPALIQALAKATPGMRVLLAPGPFAGNCRISGLKGTPAGLIIIRSREPHRPAMFQGGEVGLQLIGCSYVLIEGVIVEGASLNNIQIGDGSHHVILKDVVSRNIRGRANCDGIKMPGLTDFLLYNCAVANWGGEGSAIDMVGCARGLVMKTRFAYPNVSGQTANAIQPKGGTHAMGFYRCVFDDASHRVVQFGGATGRQYFFQDNHETGYEGLDMVAMGNVIRGGGSGAAFISCTRCRFEYNTIVEPREYVLRILKEGGAKPTANNTFAHNLIVYGKGNQVLNHGGPESVDLRSFTFAENYWYNRSDPSESIPTLPVQESHPAGGKDPRLDRAFQPAADGPAAAYGAFAPGLAAAWKKHVNKFPWAWQQALRFEDDQGSGSGVRVP